MDSAPKPERFGIGYVAKAHGLKGEVGIRTFDPASTSLFDVQTLILETRGGETVTHKIQTRREGTKEVLVQLVGVRHRDQAEPLVGAKVFVLRADLPAPAEGEFFLGDLVGLEAFDEAGASLGQVEEVMDLGAAPNLVIRQGEVEHLVPFADDFVLDVLEAERRVVVRLPVYED